jgi:hypothetical protein
MNIKRIELEQMQLPSLAWVARVSQSEPGEISLWCGKRVEVGRDFVVEGVWPGPFSQADFVDSDLFYGSGFKLSAQGVTFSSSCSTVDRLWSHELDGIVTVSNSLPCLLSVAGAELLWDDDSYAGLVETIVKGMDYHRSYPIDKGTLNLHYFENIVVNSEGVEISAKKQNAPCFRTFQSYSDFLFNTAKRIGDNAKDEGREFPVEVFSTISRGYDSPVATLMAKTAGATYAYTFSGARSLIPREDSGTEICRIIELECKEFSIEKKAITDEVWFWAANGSLQDMNLSIFSYPPGVSVMFTGFNGDMVWSKSAANGKNFLKRKDSTGLGFCEYRLWKGVIHCPVPFWGISRLAEIKNISLSEEMESWEIGGEYDRPIPRRIVESCGVPRSYFGQKKSATTIDELLLLPLNNYLRVSYRKYVTNHYTPLSGFFFSQPFRFAIDLWRSAFRERLLKAASRLGLPLRIDRTFKWERYLFPWANGTLMASKRLISGEGVDNGTDRVKGAVQLEAGR